MWQKWNRLFFIAFNISIFTDCTEYYVRMFCTEYYDVCFVQSIMYVCFVQSIMYVCFVQSIMYVCFVQSIMYVCFLGNGFVDGSTSVSFDDVSCSIDSITGASTIACTTGPHVEGTFGLSVIVNSEVYTTSETFNYAAANTPTIANGGTFIISSHV